MKLNLILYPFLFAIYPLLFFYSRNAWLFPVQELLYAAAVILGASLITFCLLVLVLRRAHAAAVLTSAAFLAFFSSEAVFSQFLGLIKLRYVAVIYAALIMAALYLILRYVRDKKRFTFILNLVALFLIILPLFDIARNLYQMNLAKPEAQENIQKEELNNQTSLVGPAPDIYYIILDGYAHTDTLKKHFGFDNTPFYEYLSSKGFYIVPESRTNYGITNLSLASSLNMRYLTEKDGASESTFSSYRLINIISNNAVYDFLKERGYTSVFVGSGFYGKENFGASVFFVPKKGSSFSRPYKTFLIAFLESAAHRILDKPATLMFGQVQYVFDQVKEIADSDIPRPIFVFAHVFAPHLTYDPYDLDPDFNKITQKKDDQRRYLDRLLCANKEAKEVIDEILAKSTTPPIIILQSDHGPDFTDESSQEGKISVTGAQVKLRNFTALYLPDGGQEVIPPDLTPVNLFRLIFNHYFGSDYELLEDKSYYVCEFKCLNAKGEAKVFFDFTEEAKF